MINVDLKFPIAVIGANARNIYPLYSPVFMLKWYEKYIDRRPVPGCTIIDSGGRRYTVLRSDRGRKLYWWPRALTFGESQMVEINYELAENGILTFEEFKTLATRIAGKRVAYTKTGLHRVMQTTDSFDKVMGCLREIF